MPPKKKYRTIIIPHSGCLSMPTSVPPPAIAEREERTQPDEDGRADGEQRVDDDVALRDLRILRKVVRGWLCQQQEERVQATQKTLLIGPIELGVLEAHRLQGLHTLAGLRDQLVAEPKLDGLGRTSLGARGPEAVVDAVIAEGALLGRAGVLVEADDPERARRHAVPTAVADVLVDVDGTELRSVNRAGRARVQTSRLSAVLANVGHQEPGEVPARAGAGRFHEAHEPERRVGEVRLILIAPGPLGLLHAELVPLLAGDLAGPTADTQGGVREHRQCASHGYTTPFLTLQTKAFVSWM